MNGQDRHEGSNIDLDDNDCINLVWLLNIAGSTIDSINPLVALFTKPLIVLAAPGPSLKSRLFTPLLNIFVKISVKLFFTIMFVDG